MGSTVIDIVYSLAAMLVTLGILVTIHEYGHFSVARWCAYTTIRKLNRTAVGQARQ